MNTNTTFTQQTGISTPLEKNTISLKQKGETPSKSQKISKQNNSERRRFADHSISNRKNPKKLDFLVKVSRTLLLNSFILRIL